MTLAAGKRTLKCRNDSLFQHFCTCRLEGEALLHLDLTARRVWWVSRSLTLPVSDINQSKMLLRFPTALIRSAALEPFCYTVEKPECEACIFVRTDYLNYCLTKKCLVEVCRHIELAATTRCISQLLENFHYSVFPSTWIWSSLSWYNR